MEHGEISGEGPSAFAGAVADMMVAVSDMRAAANFDPLLSPLVRRARRDYSDMRGGGSGHAAARRAALVGMVESYIRGRAAAAPI